jgi:hypothetical protein
LFGGGAGVIAVMAFADEKQNCIASAGEFAGAAGDAFADATDDLGLGLTGGPGDAFPLAHLRSANDWNRHGSEAWQNFFLGKSIMSCGSRATNELAPNANS